jgi:hypothetical protein
VGVLDRLADPQEEVKTLLDGQLVPVAVFGYRDALYQNNLV